MADYFDRLLARYTPVAAADGGAGAGGDGTGEGGTGGTGTGGMARVRPRLPGPFERVEALRTAPPEPDAPASLLPTAPQPAFGPAESVRHEREVRTDRHTVVRAAEPPGDGLDGRTPPAVPRGGPDPRPSARPSATVPVRRGGDGEGARTARRTADGEPAGPSPALLAPPGLSAPPAPPPLAGRTRPRDTDTAAVRGAAQAGAGRRTSRPAERVVHVQIGRLEVSAAPPPAAPRPAADRPGPAGRRAPVLTLDDYLARGERSN
ncbi:hypothetical protein AB0O07_02850 [Streptomyces sp. NPDC093085]|uniref:hypothetical protein n=1 Tax=Streptomyces sp. NPDC093085 TaxID=3155068 RepID=UPI00344A1552